MNELEEMSFRHIIDQLEEENRQLREEAKRLRLAVNQYFKTKHNVLSAQQPT